MELQGLQEALKVEIQCHQKLVAQMKQEPQDGELKKQLHERQTRITALSEKQKLPVRGCPMGSTKPVSLIKPPSQSIAISVVPAKSPVSMVTAHINGQKAAGSEPLQTAPINLQTTSKVAGSGLSSVGRRVSEQPHSQVLGTLTAVPIKVPHVSSLQRLAGQASTLLPQVRPKTLIPDSLPHSPCQEQLSSQPPSLQKAPAVVSSKSQGPGPALPTANSTFSPAGRPNGKSAPASSPASPTMSTGASGAGVAYAIIAASPSHSTSSSATSEAVKVQPLLFSSDNKVIIIQPQASGSPQNSPGQQADSPTQDLPATNAPPSKKKREEDPEKIAFMTALGLVTTDYLEEIQSKRQERKRRSTANPAYSGLFEPERKRHASHFLNNPLFLSARGATILPPDPPGMAGQNITKHMQIIVSVHLTVYIPPHTPPSTLDFHSILPQPFSQNGFPEAKDSKTLHVAMRHIRETH